MNATTQEKLEAVRRLRAETKSRLLSINEASMKKLLAIFSKIREERIRALRNDLQK